MSYDIDQKIVEMQFNNEAFEQHAGETLSTLQKLKNALNMSAAPLSNAIDGVTHKFSVLETIATGALLNIGAKFSNLAMNITSSLSIDQLTAGWSKYEEKTSSVQTIMAATASQFENQAEQMEYVNKQMDKLNWFTDETSYNFLDMANNIGKFTSNGVKLEDARIAMQGISTWAAISGGKVQEAQRAMYNLSQSMSMGKVLAMDWKSIEMANMATLEFKQMAIDTAVAMGTLEKTATGTYISLVSNQEKIVEFNASKAFRDSLKDDWFTADVLQETLKKYGTFSSLLQEATEETGIYASEMLRYIDDYKAGNLDLAATSEETGVEVYKLKELLEILGHEELELGRKAFKAAQEAKTFHEAIDATKDAVSTGWMNIYENIFGDYLTAKKVWTAFAEELYEIFAEPLKETNNMLKKWATMEVGGREDLFAGIAGHWNNLKDILGAVKDAFRDVFPKMTAERLAKLVKGFKDLSEKLKPSKETVDKIRRSFRGLFTIFKIGINVAKLLWRAFSPLLGVFKPLAGMFGNMTAGLGDNIVKFNEWLEKNQNIKNLVEKTRSVMIKLVSDFSKYANIAIGKLGQWYDQSKKFLSPHISKYKNNIFAFIKKSADSAGKALLDFFKSIKGMKFNFSFSKPTFGRAKDLQASTSIFQSIAKTLKGSLESIGDFFIQMGKNIAIGMSSAGKALSTDIPGKLMKLIKGLLGIWTLINVNKLISSWRDINYEMAKFIKGARKKFFSTSARLIDNVQEVAKALLIFAGAIYILAKAIQILGGMDKDQIMAGVIGISTLVGAMTISLAILSKVIGDKKLKVGFLNLLGFAYMISSIGKALALVANNDVKSIEYATGGLVTSILAVTMALKVISESKGSIMKASVGATIFAVALKMLAGTMVTIGNLSTENIIKGGTTLIVLLGSLAIAMRLISNLESPSKAAGVNAILIGHVLLTLTGTMALLSLFSDDRLIKGGIALVSLMGVLVGAMMILSKIQNGGDILKAAIGMNILALAINTLIPPLYLLGKMHWTTLVQGGLAFAGVLTAITLSMRNMPANSTILSIGAGIFMIALAMNSLVRPIRLLGELPIQQLIVGIVAVGALLAGLTIAMRNMPNSEILISTSLAIVAVALAIRTLINPIMILSKLSLGQMITSLLGFAGIMAVLVLGLNRLARTVSTTRGLGRSLKGLGKGMLLIGLGLMAISKGIEIMANVIGKILVGALNSVGTLSMAVSSAINGLLEGIMASMPTIKKFLDTLIKMLVDLLITNADVLSKGFLDLILNTVRNLAQYAPLIIPPLFDFLNYLLDELIARLPEIAYKFTKLVILLFNYIVEAAKSLPPEVLENARNGFLAVGLMMVAAAAINKIAKSAYKGLLKMVGFAAILGVVFTAIGAIALIPGVGDLISGGGTLLKTLGDAVTGLGNLAIGVMVIAPIAAAFDKIASSAIPGLLKLSVFIGILGVVVGLLGFLNTPEVLSFINGGGKVLAELGNAIGSFVGAIVGGFLNHAFGQLGGFGQELANFMTAAKPFFDEVVKIGPDAFGAVSSLAVAILALTAADILKGIANFVSWLTGGNSLSQFGEELVSFAPNLRKFGDEVKGIDASTVEGVANATKMLADMARSLPNSGGLLADLVGDNTLSQFGAELVVYGPYLKQYAEDVKDIKPEAVEGSANATKILADMAKAIPNQGGVLAALAGDNTLSQFGYELVLFGPSLKQYASDVKGISGSSVVGSANAGKIMAGLASSLPNSGGLVAWISGDNTLDEFGRQLSLFGPQLAYYARSVGDLKPSSVAASAYAGEMLIQLQEDLPTSGGLFDWLSGKKDFEIFGNQLIKFGKGLAGYGEIIKNIDYNQLINVTKAVNELVIIAQGIQNVDFGKFGQFATNFNKMGSLSIDQFLNNFSGADDKVRKAISHFFRTVLDWTESNKLDLITAHTKLGESLVKGFVENFSDPFVLTAVNLNLNIFMNKIKDALKKGLESEYFVNIGKTLVSNIAKGIIESDLQLQYNLTAFTDIIKKRFSKDFNDMSYKDLGKVTIEQIKKGMQYEINQLLVIIEAFGNSIYKTLDKALKRDLFKKLGQDVGYNFLSGVSTIQVLNKMNKVAKFMQKMLVSAFASEIKRSDYIYIGRQIPIGLWIGIREEGQKLKEAVIAMCDDIVNAAKSRLDIHSPSRVFKEIGGHVVEGMQIGLESQSLDKAANAALVKPLMGSLTELSNTDAGAVVGGLVKGIGDGFSSADKRFDILGRHAMLGLQLGLGDSSATSSLLETARNVSKAVYDIFNETLNPKKFEAVGESINYGAETGIKNNTKMFERQEINDVEYEQPEIDYDYDAPDYSSFGDYSNSLVNENEEKLDAIEKFIARKEKKLKQLQSLEQQKESKVQALRKQEEKISKLKSKNAKASTIAKAMDRMENLQRDIEKKDREIAIVNSELEQIEANKERDIKRDVRKDVRELSGIISDHKNTVKELKQNTLDLSLKVAEKERLEGRLTKAIQEGKDEAVILELKDRLARKTLEIDDLSDAIEGNNLAIENLAKAGYDLQNRLVPYLEGYGDIMSDSLFDQLESVVDLTKVKELAADLQSEELGEEETEKQNVKNAIHNLEENVKNYIEEAKKLKQNTMALNSRVKEKEAIEQELKAAISRGAKEDDLKEIRTRLVKKNLEVSDLEDEIFKSEIAIKNIAEKSDELQKFLEPFGEKYAQFIHEGIMKPLSKKVNLDDIIDLEEIENTVDKGSRRVEESGSAAAGKAGESIGQSGKDGFDTGLNEDGGPRGTLNETFEGMGTDLDHWRNKLFGDINQNGKDLNEGVATIGKQTPGAFSKGFNSTSHIPVKDSKMVADKIKGELHVVEDEAPIIGKKTTEKYAAGINDPAANQQLDTNAKKASSTVHDGFTSELKADKVYDITKDSVLKLDDGLNDRTALGEIKTSSSEVSKKTYDGLNIINTELKPEKIADNAVDKISFRFYAEDIKRRIKEAGGVIGEEATNAIAGSLDASKIESAVDASFGTLIGNLFDRARQMSRDIVDGLNKGVAETEEEIRQTGANLTKPIIRGAKETLDIHSPSRVFYGIGEYIVEGLHYGVTDNMKQVGKDGRKLGNAMINGLEDGVPKDGWSTNIDYNHLGQDMVNNLAAGIASDTYKIPTAVKKITSKIMDIFNGDLDPNKIKELGRKLIIELANGLNEPSGVSSVRSRVASISNEILGELRINMSSEKFRQIGLQAMNGLSQGIQEGSKNINVPDLTSDGKNMMRGLGKGIKWDSREPIRALDRANKRMINNTRKTFMIASPSKLFKQFGEYLMIGFSQGIYKESKALNNTMDVSLVNPVDIAVNKMFELLENGMDFAPTIRPVMDLSDVDRGISQTNKKFHGLNLGAIAANLSGALNNADAYRNSKSVENKAPVVNNWTMNQHNHSPKALSRADIYRQTRSQFKTLKEAIQQ